MKSKIVAGSLAFFFGIFGVHRFYLGNRVFGILHFLLFLFTFAISIEENAPIVLIPALLGFIDAVLLFAMPNLEFDEKYNSRFIHHHQEPESSYRYVAPAPPARYRSPKEDFHLLKKRGIDRFRNFDFQGAIDDFTKCLDFQFENPSIHFNLACCYSLTENGKQAFYHLEKAVAFGFSDIRKIHTHDALSYVRSLRDFDIFVANDYRMPSVQPLPQQEPALPEDQLHAQSDDLLTQIAKLGDLKEKGILTEEEFAAQKRKLLR